MRWKAGNRHLGDFWKTWAWRPRWCSDCDSFIWLEPVYKQTWDDVFICPGCLTVRKFKEEEEAKGAMTSYWENLQAAKKVAPLPPNFPNWGQSPPPPPQYGPAILPGWHVNSGSSNGRGVNT